MMAWHSGASVALGGMLILAGVSARGESLGDAWATALRVNQGIQSQQSQSTAAGLDLSAAKAARLPTIRTMNYNVLLTNSPTIKTPFGSALGGAGGSAAAGLSPYFHFLGPNQNDLPISFTMATVPLYTGGKLLRDIDAADHQAAQQRTEEFRSVLDLKLKVAEAFVEVLRARKALDVARSNVASLASFARDTTNRRTQGLAIKSDELAAGVSLANAQLGEIQARTMLETSWATYNRYLGRPLSAVAELEEVSEPPAGADWSNMARQAVRADSDFARVDEAELATMINRAFRERPELAGLAEEAKGLNARAESTLSNIRPKLSVGGGFVYLGAQTFAPQGFGVAVASLDWNLTDGGASRRRAAAIHQREHAALKQRADLADDVALEVRTRWLALRQARLRVPVAEYAVIQAEANIKVVTDRYREGLSTYTEVIDAEDRRVQSLTNAFNARYDESLALFRLHRSIGDI